MNIKNKLKKIGIGFLIFIVLLFIIPYLIPLSESKAQNNSKPFSNSHFIEIDGMWIHYRIWLNEHENKKNEWILFVHGLGGSTYSWENNTKLFCDSGYQVVAVDVPPFGYSDRDPDFNHSPDQNATLLWKFAIKMNPSVKWHLIGHSMGGGIVEAMSILNPEKTKSVVFVDPALFKTLTYSFSFTQLALRFAPIERLFSVVGEYFFINKKQISKMLYSAYGRSASNKEIEEYYKALSVDGTARAFIRAFTKSKVITQMDFSQFKTPALAIWGNQDTWVPIDSYKSMIESSCNIELKIILGAHHCPMETHINEFNEVVLKFLKNQ